MSPARGGRAAVLGALLLVQIFFGLHYLAAKIVVAAVPPRAWAAIRVAVAAPIVFAIAAALGRSLRFSPRDLGRLALYSVFGVVINQICFVEGIHRTTPTHSALINTTIPVGTLLAAVLLGRERLGGWKVATLVVSLAGVLLVIHPERAAFSEATVTGDLLSLANAMSYSLFLVLSKPLLSRCDPLAATAWLLGFGAIGVLAVGSPALLRFQPAQVPRAIWALGAFIVLFATVAAYFLNYFALARVDSSVVALFIYLQPLIAAGLGASVLGERPEARVVGGGALVFLGVYLASGPRWVRSAGSGSILP